MPPSFLHWATGASESFENAWKSQLAQATFNEVRIASAFATGAGVRHAVDLLADQGNPSVRALLGVDGWITQPQALRRAVEEGWKIAVPQNHGGLFHVKLFVLTGATRFLTITGSSNLTRGGFIRNTEANVFIDDERQAKAAVDIFDRRFSEAQNVDQQWIDKYEESYAIVNQSRSTEMIATLLGLEADQNAFETTEDAGAYSTKSALCAWAGLESTTGEHTYQVEFPRLAGEALGRICNSPGTLTEVDVACPDGVSRTMKVGYYDHNSMWRLNVPNDVPGVKDAKEARHGLAVIRREDDGTVHFNIIQDAEGIEDMKKRTRLLGTIGQTTTRHYGWF